MSTHLGKRVQSYLTMLFLMQFWFWLSNTDRNVKHNQKKQYINLVSYNFKTLTITCSCF